MTCGFGLSPVHRRFRPAMILAWCLGLCQVFAFAFPSFSQNCQTMICRFRCSSLIRRTLFVSQQHQRAFLHLSQAVNGDSDDQRRRTTQTLPSIPQNEDAHRIIFLRHGESEFNNANIFTGWCDVALTQRGVVESVEAGQVFASHSLTFRKCYCSLLTRSIVTAHRTLEATGISYTPLVYDWRLNERHYGALQGIRIEGLRMVAGLP